MKTKPTVGTEKNSAARISIGPGRRILVVDDEPLICDMSREVLLRRGYGVNIMTDGDLAWQALQSGSYDLLITDQNMPGLSGVELVRKLRAAGMDLPVIMTSGLSVDELLKQESLRLSAVLSKPFTAVDFVSTVEAVLQMHPPGTIRSGSASISAPPISAETITAMAPPLPQPIPRPNISKR